MLKEDIAQTYRSLQQDICTQLENADGAAMFSTDKWEKEIGHGFTMVLQNGHALEKAAVNFSAVEGTISEPIRKALDIESGEKYFATGISSIIHPNNPHVPIIHANVRYFELGNGQKWFGGGIDLTPHYIHPAEAQWFHRQLKSCCDKFNADYYARFKQQADDYFFLPHRDETRGIGGIFFDHLHPDSEENQQELFNFTTALAKLYPQLYIHLLNGNRDTVYSQQEKEWQLLRRGRYIEFNLLYDRGTRFGLKSKGRTESIFLSMPPQASWEYKSEPEIGSKEAETLSLLKKDIDWINRPSL